MASARDISPSDEVHAFGSELQQAYWGVRGAAQQQASDYVTASQVADYLADVGRLSMSRQKVTSLLDACGPAVKRKRLRGKRVYQLMRPAEQAISNSLPGTVIVDPTKPFEEIRKFEVILNGLTGVVRICDPYLDNKSLDYLAEMTTAEEIRVLTYNLLDEKKLRRDLAALRKQFSTPIEIRMSPMNDNHDRFILSGGQSFLMGGSLNGFAKKRSMITPISGVLHGALMEIFEREWSQAKTFS